MMPQFLTNPHDIQQWLDTYCSITGRTTIAEDGTVTVTGSVIIKDGTDPYIRVEFAEVTGNFDCSKLTTLMSLAGSPRTVGGNFYCFYCDKLLTLQGGPDIIGGNFNCVGCSQLKTLEGAPTYVGGNFNCRCCSNLQTLRGSPKHVLGDFECSDCSALSNTEGINRIDGKLCFTQFLKPTPAMLRQIINQEICVATPQKSEWLDLLYDYRRHRDILITASAFEALFQAPLLEGSVKPDEPLSGLTL